MLQKRQKKTHAGNLHISNDDNVTGDMLMDPPEATVENNDSARRLSVDDTEAGIGGNTHTSILAKAAKKKLKAEGPGASQTVDIEEDPAAGYLEDDISPLLAQDDLADDFISDEVVSENGEDVGDDTSETFVNNNESPDVLIAEGGGEEWDPVESENEDAEEAPEEDEDDKDEDLDEEVDLEASEDPDALDLVDVDDMDDTLAGVSFASVGKTLHVIKANRIIASINSKVVAKHYSDLYTSNQFHQTVAYEIKKQGLRKALATFGFKNAKVSFAKAALINKRVEAKVGEQRKALDALAATKAKRFEQSLTIAAVGINRNFFKGQRNALRAALEDALLASGFRDAKRFTARLFSEHGVVYAKSILEQAKKLEGFSDRARNELAEVLDVTDDPDAPEDDLVDDISEGIEEAAGEEEDDEDGWDDVQEAKSIQASLMKPAYKRSIPPKRVSVSASAILNGDVPLTFNI